MRHFNKYSGNLYRLILLIIIVCFVISPLSSLTLHAQETQKPTEAKPAAQLSLAEWKAVEGVFQSPQNSEMNVQFIAKENVLMAKLLWNNKEIPLTPESPLVFFNSEANEGSPLRISFIKDSAGAITKVTVVNNEVWKKVNNYKAVEKIEMAHTPEQLKPFEGLYQLQNTKDRFIQFIVKGNNLVLKQHWDGNEIPFVPETELDFFSKVARMFALTFTKEADGSISQALLFKRDRWIKVKKEQPNQAQLKAVEGKYQFKDDPDNFIQIMAKGNNLVVKQLWDGKEIVVEPQTELYFYNNNESYPLQVIKDPGGAVIQVQVLGVDLFNKVKG